LKPRSTAQNGLISLSSLTGLTSEDEFWDLVRNLD
jgi:hypothetical protein